MTLAATSPAAARALAERGEATLIDLRPPAAFARGHPAGALSVPFSPRGLAARVRVALPADSALVLVAPDDATGETATAQLRAAGLEVRGILEGGFEGWQAAGLPAAAVREVAIDELSPLADVATVIDVREPLEWMTGHVPGALLVPLGRLREAVASIPRDRAVIAICEAGIRSSTAASILGAAGFADVAHVPVGSAGYRRSGLPLAFPSEEVLAR
jgi:rhodanese-related sulfurtransferase